jgi:ribosomal protein L20
MARVKRGVTGRARHKKVVDLASGYVGRSGTTFRAALQRLEAAHLSGQANHGLKLWTLLLFHEWWSQLHEP